MATRVEWRYRKVDFWAQEVFLLYATNDNNLHSYVQPLILTLKPLAEQAMTVTVLQCAMLKYGEFESL